MHAGQDQCRPVIAHTPWLMRAELGWYAQTLFNVAWLMLSRNNWTCLVDVHMAGLVRAGLGWCFMHLANVTCEHTFHIRAQIPLMIPYVIGECLTPDTHFHVRAWRPWVKLHAFVHCRIPDAHMPHNMRVDFSCCFLLWPTCEYLFVRATPYWQATFNVSRWMCAG